VICAVSNGILLVNQVVFIFWLLILGICWSCSSFVVSYLLDFNCCFCFMVVFILFVSLFFLLLVIFWLFCCWLLFVGSGVLTHVLLLSCLRSVQGSC